MQQRLAEEILAKQIQLWTCLHFDVAIDDSAATQTHCRFVTDERHARNGIWNGHGLELDPFAERHRVGVLHPLGDEDAAGATGAKAHAIDVLVDRSAKSIDALVEVDTGLRCLTAKVSTFSDLNFLLFLDEFDNGHGSF